MIDDRSFKLLSELETHEGLSIAEVSRRVGCTWHTAQGMVSLLQQMQIVFIVGEGREQKVYPTQKGVKLLELSRQMMEVLR